ncbi:hypothetical protein GFS24_14865 [Chitinophaga sp. SYP-B3965]|uniref:hypothetical protein n=1 Tax=Chitinophaga sp. SYP-B3965 TaxID=2663120 RepID=UPI0012995DA2|nr:hypothetical protein [Chitinophaga sp. SYP-B3965]MRG46401.1 hypothetical protein [Chitinophaga sp. SYP-B3965]
MRLFLLLFILIPNLANAQKLRLKNLQFGPTLAVQVDRPDTTLADIRKLVKDPLRFPKNSLDTLEREFGRGLFYGSTSHVQVSLLTTWELNSDKKSKWGLQKEWRIGIEYSYVGNNEERWSAVDATDPSKYAVNEVFFRRNNHMLGLYTDFILKKSVARNRISFYGGLGGYLAYAISGNVLETKTHRVDSEESAVEKYRHATLGRRDIAVLFPIGLEMRPGNQRRPLGVTFGIRPGFMIIKEKNYAAFMPGMLGFNVRLMYNLY